MIVAKKRVLYTFGFLDMEIVGISHYSPICREVYGMKTSLYLNLL